MGSVRFFKVTRSNLVTQIDVDEQICFLIRSLKNNSQKFDISHSFIIIEDTSDVNDL